LLIYRTSFEEVLSLSTGTGNGSTRAYSL